MPYILEDPVDVTPGANESWETVNIADEVDSRLDPVCGMFRVRNNTSDVIKYAGVRPEGNSWSYDEWATGTEQQFFWGGLDSNGSLDLHRHGNMTIELYGVIDDSEGVGLSSPTEITGWTADEWDESTVDLSNFTNGGEIPHLALVMVTRDDRTGHNHVGMGHPDTWDEIHAHDSDLQTYELTACRWPRDAVGIMPLTKDGDVYVVSDSDSNVRFWLMGYVTDSSMVNRVAEHHGEQTGWETHSPSVGSHDHAVVVNMNAQERWTLIDDAQVDADMKAMGASDRVHKTALQLHGPIKLNQYGEYETYIGSGAADPYATITTGSLKSPELIEPTGFVSHSLTDDDTIHDVPVYDPDDVDGPACRIEIAGDVHAYALADPSEAAFPGLRIDIDGTTYAVDDLGDHVEVR